MKFNNKLTADRARELFNYDQSTGILTWSRDKGRGKAGEQAGTQTPYGYIRTHVDGHNYLVHRIIWLIIYGEWPKYEIDHINFNKSDNRLCNLRDATHSTNQENIYRPRANNKLGLIGVVHEKKTNKYVARIRVKGDVIQLGYFAYKEDAANAYLLAKRKLHDGCTI